MRHDQLVPSVVEDESLRPLITTCPVRCAPLLVDDRSHVKSVIYDNDSDDDDNDNDDEVPEEEEHSKMSSSDQKTTDETTTTTRLTTPLSESNCFLRFYGGDAAVRFEAVLKASSSSPQRHDDGAASDHTVVMMTCNVLRLHSLLRPPSSSSSASASTLLPQHIFGSADDVDQSILELFQRDPIARFEFIKSNVDLLSKALMPTAQAVDTTVRELFSSSSSSSSSNAPSNVCSFVSTMTTTADAVTVPAHIHPVDARSLFDRPDLLDRYLYSYAILLGAFGWRLHDFQDGTVDRAHNWRERYAELLGNTNNHNSNRDAVVAAVCGMLRSLIDMRMRRIATKFVQFIFEELLAGRLLALRRVWELVWVPMVLVRGLEVVEEEDDNQVKNKTSSWVFNEAQRNLWLERLDASSSSGDDE